VPRTIHGDVTVGTFFSPLIAERDGKDWTLHDSLHFWSNTLNEMLIVPRGFITDFASVPRIPLAFWLAGDTAHASAVIHDYLLSLKYARPLAAEVFREAMIAEGVPSWRRWLMYNSVRWPI
jgi:Protein of unknown function (DUF1353)